MNDRVRILLIDDDEEEYFLLKELVSRPTEGRSVLSFDLDWVSSYEEAVSAFLKCQYDLYLVDFHLGGRSGLDLLREPAARRCPAPVIMLTGQGSYETDLSAMQLGVADYLEKSRLTLPLLERAIRYAIEQKQAEKRLETLVEERTKDLALLKKQAQGLDALQKATSSLLHTLDLSRLVGKILDAACDVIPSTEQCRLHIVQQHAWSGRLAQIPWNDPRIRRIPIPEDVSGPLKRIREGDPVRIANMQDELLLMHLFTESEQEESAVRSAIIAPLTYDEEVLGALSLGASMPSVFSEEDLRLLTTFAATSTAAIRNAIFHAEIQGLAATDPLTGRLNRRTFFEHIQREIERFHRFGHLLSVMMFDVDLFKKINDKYGHSVGDEILITVSDRCCSVIRQVDVLARFGGDEFVILLPETDHHMAMEIANRVRTSVSESPIVTEAGPVWVSISIGITQATHDTADSSILLNQADQALYNSKRAGRNTIAIVL